MPRVAAADQRRSVADRRDDVVTVLAQEADQTLTQQDRVVGDDHSQWTSAR